MENTNNLNTVTIPLSDYNVMKSNLETSRDLLSKTMAEANILRTKELQQKSNSIIVLERRDGYKVTEKLELDINDPIASAKVLDIISKVDTAELSKAIEDKESQIKSLKFTVSDLNYQLQNGDKDHTRTMDSILDSKVEEIRKLKKGYETTINELNDDKDLLVQSLADLKVDKTKEQLELAHAQELQDLNEKLNALNLFKSRINGTTNPFKLWNLIKRMEDADHFVTEYPWYNKLKARTNDAVETLRSFAEIIGLVGKLPEKKCDKRVEPCCVPSFSGYSIAELAFNSKW